MESDDNAGGRKGTDTVLYWTAPVDQRGWGMGQKAAKEVPRREYHMTAHHPLSMATPTPCDHTYLYDRVSMMARLLGIRSLTAWLNLLRW